MRDIDFVPEVIAELAPHLPTIEKRFNQWNKTFKGLLAQDHDLIGRVLKCHLIIENYINHHLESVFPSLRWESARLQFAKKVELLPQTDARVAWILPGIKEINGIRNRLSYSITASVSLDDLTKGASVLANARRGKDYKNPIELVEDFTAVACTCLIVDPEIERVFVAAFRRAQQKDSVAQERS
jgi:hypothetical protein